MTRPLHLPHLPLGLAGQETETGDDGACGGTEEPREAPSCPRKGSLAEAGGGEEGAPAPAESLRPPRLRGLPGPGAGLRPGLPSEAALVAGGALAAPSRSRRPPTPSASGSKGDRWLAWGGVIMSAPLGHASQDPGAPLLTWRPNWR